MANHHNIESRRFPGHAYYVGYASAGIFHIRKTGKRGLAVWRADSAYAWPHEPVTIHTATLAEMSAALSLR